MSESSEEIKRWTARRKATAVIDILKGKTSAAETARSHDLTLGEVERWMEDFVSMATNAARRLGEMADNLAGIVAIELLASCQGVYLRRPLRSSPVLEGAVEQVHGVAPAFDQDRFFAPSIEAVKSLVVGGNFRSMVPPDILPTGSVNST